MTTLTVATNISGINISRQLGNTAAKASDHSQNLASGSRLTRASSDAAALAIGQRLDSLINNMAQAHRNALQGGAVISVAIGGTEEIGNLLDRMKVLTSISASDGVDDNARELADEEFQKLLDQINNISSQTKFNGIELIGSSSLELNFRVNTETTDTVVISMPLLSSTQLGVSGNIQTRVSAVSASQLIDSALADVRKNIAEFGAFQAQLNSAASNLAVGIENAKGAKSSFVDANMADEMIMKSKYEMLLQTGFAGLSATFKNLQTLTSFVQNN